MEALSNVLDTGEGNKVTSTVITPFKEKKKWRRFWPSARIERSAGYDASSVRQSVPEVEVIFFNDRTPSPFDVCVHFVLYSHLIWHVLR